MCAYLINQAKFTKKTNSACLVFGFTFSFMDYQEVLSLSHTVLPAEPGPQGNQGGDPPLAGDLSTFDHQGSGLRPPAVHSVANSVCGPRVASSTLWMALISRPDSC